jgi:hypothetical protein
MAGIGVAGILLEWPGISSVAHTAATFDRLARVFPAKLTLLSLKADTHVMA